MLFYDLYSKSSTFMEAIMKSFESSSSSSTTKKNDHPFAICVTAKKSPSINNSASSSDAAQFFCPYTGKSLGSIKVGTGVGVHSISHLYLRGDEGCFLMYAGKSRDDMNACLCSLQCGNVPKWKSRVPEYMEGGLKFSPCGQFIFGAGSSGHCYVWSTFNEGSLLRAWSAHYRAVQTITFSDCGSYVLTGGADGVVNAWSLLDIVSQDEDHHIQQKSNIIPIRTWSTHHLSVSCLHAIPSGRIISSSPDRQLAIMEIFSGRTLARIMLPSAIETITTDATAHRLYAGGSDGTIYCIDLDLYEVANTAESATTIFLREKSSSGATSNNGTSHISQSVLGIGKENLDTSEKNDSSPRNSHISEFKGHQRKIISLVLLEHENNDDDLLISSSEDGTVRVWDVRSRCSARVLVPWPANGSLNQSSKLQSNPKSMGSSCPVILAISREYIENLQSSAASKEMLSGVSRNEREHKYSNLIKPLQRFVKNNREQFSSGDDKTGFRNLISMIQSTQQKHSLDMWITISKRSKDLSVQSVQPMTKKQKISSEDAESNKFTNLSERDNIETEQKEKIDKLTKELEDAKTTIERWQAVNNKLVQKLNKSKR